MKLQHRKIQDLVFVFTNICRVLRVNKELVSSVHRTKVLIYSQVPDSALMYLKQKPVSTLLDST